MRWVKVLVVLLAFLLTAGYGALADDKTTGDSRCVSERENFDDGWKFSLAAPDDAFLTDFDDASWRRISVPHDWAIGGPFRRENPSSGQGAFAPMGIGWYRKHFTARTICNPRTVIQFDGVMANSDVWINGHPLGHRPSGYATFRYDLTPYLNHDDKPNVLTVRADNNDQPSSRFYQGAGIYRHVWLLHTPAVYRTDWSTAITTPVVKRAIAEIVVKARIRNDGPLPASFREQVSIADSNGKVVASGTTKTSQIASGAEFPVELHLEISMPQLWDIDRPHLYSALIHLISDGKRDDVEAIRFGIRDAHFEADTGFWLNGRNLKIKGVALHSDIGALGMVSPLSLWRYRLQAMQRMGANAIRTAHNEVSPELLDLCDQMGMLVLDEFFDMWTVAKNRYDYHLYFRDWYLRDTRDGVMRDRNHPSIIAWSAGNEIHDTPKPEIAKPILEALVAEYHKADPSRPVTQALFRPNASHDYQNGLADLLDVVGQNYRPNEILAAHNEKPTRKILGTENVHDRESWLAVRDHAPYSGLFIWSGTDYLGESRHWPMIGDESGLVDRTEAAKPDALEHESWWYSLPVVHIVRRSAPTEMAPTDPGYEVQQYRPKRVVFADWSPADRSRHIEHVEVYSNCASVSLIANGVDLGAKPLPADLAPRLWDVEFSPGSLEARCGDRPFTTETLHTSGPAFKVEMRLEVPATGSGFDDVARVRAVVVDRDGVPVPDAEVPLHFQITGPASLIATDNADVVYSAPFQNPDRKTFRGSAVIFFRPTQNSGAVRVSATAPGLLPGVLNARIERKESPSDRLLTH